jgi:S1-C subfamily serine protease
MQAEKDESVPVHTTNGEVEATVKAFDHASGFVLLAHESFAAPVDLAESLPGLGSLAVEIAYPVPSGHESRLSMIRCVGGSTRMHGGRKINHYLQTDAPRSRGFAGAVLFDPEGSLVGVTMPVPHREEGYAVPAVVLRSIVDDLLSGKVLGLGYLGVNTTRADLPVETNGARTGLLITGVEEESPAAAAGLKAGTFLVKVDGTPISDLDSLYDSLLGVSDGQELVVAVMESSGDVRDVPVHVVIRT